jgi:hypothetical protein
MALMVHVDDLDALHAELNAKQYRHMRPGIEERDWGREMTVWDPFGNRIRFTAPA